jgi:fermentation-respiration switch protein FrsA (DUF1100 family)
MLSYDKGFQRDCKSRRFDNKLYESWEKNEFQLASDYGYQLSCEMIEPEKGSPVSQRKRIAILCHGLCCARYGSIKYAELFRKLGFTVVMYDHRNHGRSGKALTTMGFYERYDLKKVVDWCYHSFGSRIQVITHGESMGAATVLMHLELDSRIKLAIADCAYSDLKLLLRHELKQYYHLPRFLIPFVSGMVYLRAGFWLKQVSPARSVERTETPVLFIHGKRDNLVPAYMSKQMYVCRRKNKGIYLIARARHAESYYANKAGYEKRVREFIEKYLPCE